MSYEKLPFKDYTVMSNNLIQNLGCADVFRTYVLLLTTDKKTLITDTTIDQLALFVNESPANYKGNKRSKSFNDKLRATGEVQITHKKCDKRNRDWTDYKFSPVVSGHYRRINRRFYEYYKDLNLKLKGFILKLFSIAKPHSYEIVLSLRKMKELIHMSHKTINDYINELKELNLILETEEGYKLMIDGLIIDEPKDKFVTETIKVFEHIISFNEKNNQPLSRECLIYKKYKQNNFKGITNMNAFMKSLQYGYIGKKREPKILKNSVIIL